MSALQSLFVILLAFEENYPTYKIKGLVHCSRVCIRIGCESLFLAEGSCMNSIMCPEVHRNQGAIRVQPGVQPGGIHI